MDPNQVVIQPAPRRKRRWIGITAITLVLVIIIGIIGLAGYVGWSLSHPVSKPITVRPEQVQLDYKDIEFSSKWENTLLRGWLIPVGDTKDRIVIMAHGYSQNRSNEKPMMPTAKALHDQGIAVLMFDFRNAGESEGTLTSVGQFEYYDLLGAIEFAKSQGYRQIGLYGLSMGAATSLNAAADSPDVQAVVADSPFADLSTYLKENLPVWSGLPPFPFTPLIMWEIPLLTGIDPNEVKPVESIAHLKDRPVLLIHAEGDDKIPASHSEQIYQNSGSPLTTFWLAPGTKHVGTYEAVPDAYLAKVIEFFTEHLQAAE